MCLNKFGELERHKNTAESGNLKKITLFFYQEAECFFCNSIITNVICKIPCIYPGMFKSVVQQKSSWWHNRICKNHLVWSLPESPTGTWQDTERELMHLAKIFWKFCHEHKWGCNFTEAYHCHNNILKAGLGLSNTDIITTFKILSTPNSYFILPE